MLIGAVPGSIDADAKKVAYQRLVDGQFALGHRSARGLGAIMRRVGHIAGIDLPDGLTDLPDDECTQENHLKARERLGLHVTNLVKCHAPTSWEARHPAMWKQTADVCSGRHLAEEISAVDPEMVVLLGKDVADYFSERESWGLERRPISKWAEQAGSHPFYGKHRFITAWTHPGGRYFWIQGQKYWDTYAEQVAGFVE